MPTAATSSYAMLPLCRWVGLQWDRLSWHLELAASSYTQALSSLTCQYNREVSEESAGSEKIEEGEWVKWVGEWVKRGYWDKDVEGEEEEEEGEL